MGNEPKILGSCSVRFLAKPGFWFGSFLLGSDSFPSLVGSAVLRNKWRRALGADVSDDVVALMTSCNSIDSAAAAAAHQPLAAPTNRISVIVTALIN